MTANALTNKFYSIFKSTGSIGGNFTFDFDNALGFVVEVDYPLNEKSYLGI